MTNFMRAAMQHEVLMNGLGAQQTRSFFLHFVSSRAGEARQASRADVFEQRATTRITNEATVGTAAVRASRRSGVAPQDTRTFIHVPRGGESGRRCEGTRTTSAARGVTRDGSAPQDETRAK